MTNLPAQELNRTGDSEEAPARLTRIAAKNFRSLQDIDIALGPLNVLIGPNGSGKTNVLNVLRFLADMTILDLGASLTRWGGYERVQRQVDPLEQVNLLVQGTVTRYSTQDAPDYYSLHVAQTLEGMRRTEVFSCNQESGDERRVRVHGTEVHIVDDLGPAQTRSLATEDTTGLSALPKLSDEDGGTGIRQLAAFLSQIRVLEPDVEKARRPSRDKESLLSEDASNLSAAMARLRRLNPDSWHLLIHDLSRCLPGLQDVLLEQVGGAGRGVVVTLVERGVRRPIELADASFGTVRLLALLTALHEPDPPAFTAIEEIDHGLHPHALDLLVDRLRAASARTQILCATHSPTFVNRLDPLEIIVCDRDPETGSSIIPATSAEQIAAAVTASDWRAGEAWFAGALAGVPV